MIRAIKNSIISVGYSMRRFPSIYRILKAGYRKLPMSVQEDDFITASLDRFANTTKDVFFIQIGSNDGITDDPLHRFIVRDNWRGILVEPVEYLFQKLKDTYKDQRSLIFEKVAVSKQAETRTFWYVKENSFSDLAYWADQLGSFDRQHIVNHLKGLQVAEDYLLQDEIECVTLSQLLEKHQVQRVDLIHIDTEGNDADVIKVIDFERIHPKLILFEHKHMRPGELEDCTALLAGKGYSVYAAGQDTLAISNG